MGWFRGFGLKGDRVSDDCRWFLRVLGFKFCIRRIRNWGIQAQFTMLGWGALGSRVSATRKKGSSLLRELEL